MKRAIVVVVSAVTAASAIVASVATADSTRVACSCGSELQARHHWSHRPVHGTGGKRRTRPAELGSRLSDQLERGPGDPGCSAHAQAHEVEGRRGRYPAEPAGRRDRRGAAAVEQGRARRQRVLRQPGERRRWADPASRRTLVRLRLGDAREPDGSIYAGRSCSEERILPPSGAARQHPGRNRRYVHASEAQRRRGGHRHGRRPGRGVLGPARQPCGHAAPGGQYRGRPSISARGADRLHVARKQGGRSESGGRLLRIAGGSRTRSCSSSSSSHVATRVRSSARTARSTRPTSRCRVRTSRRSASTSTRCRSRGRT